MLWVLMTGLYHATAAGRRILCQRIQLLCDSGRERHKMKGRFEVASTKVMKSMSNFPKRSLALPEGLAM